MRVVSGPGEEIFIGPLSRGGIDKNIYPKWERLSFNCKGTWDWSERFNWYNRQTIYYRGRTHIQHCRAPGSRNLERLATPPPPHLIGISRIHDTVCQITDSRNVLYARIQRTKAANTIIWNSYTLMARGHIFNLLIILRCGLFWLVAEVPYRCLTQLIYLITHNVYKKKLPRF
jgi:hypothetical protein